MSEISGDPVKQEKIKKGAYSGLSQFSGYYLNFEGFFVFS